MKIIQINKFNHLKGGADKYYLEISELLKKNGHQVLNFSKADISPVDFSRVKFSPTSAFKFIYNSEAKKQLEKLIKKEKPDITHIHNIHHYLTPSILTILRKHKIPVIQTVHDWQIICPNYRLLNGHGKVCEKCKKKEYWNCIVNKCVKNSYPASILNTIEMTFWNIFKNYHKYINIYITPSHFVKTKLIEWGLPEQKIKVLKHFLQTEGAPVAPGRFVGGDYFLYSGRLTKEKGIATLLKTFLKLPTQNLYLAGTGELAPKIKKFISENNIQNIKLLGYKQPNELKKIIQGAKACIVPSQWYETFGFTIAEAQILGTPVIASRIGAFPELIQHQKTGLLFKPNNVDDLINQINWFKQSSEAIKNITSQAKQQTSQKLNPKKHYENLIKIYNIAIDKNFKMR